MVFVFVIRTQRPRPTRTAAESLGFCVILPLDHILFSMKLLFNVGFRCTRGIWLFFARNARDPPDQQRNLTVFVVILLLDHIVFAMKLL